MCGMNLREPGDSRAEHLIVTLGFLIREDELSLEDRFPVFHTRKGFVVRMG